MTALGQPPTSPAGPAPSASAWPSEPPRPARRWSAVRASFAAALVGALLGGGITGAVVAATDHDRAPATTAASSPVESRPATAIAQPGDIRAILARVQPAVVRIDTTVADPFGNVSRGTGTGFVIDSSGIIATNNHVVAGASSVAVTLDDGDRLTGHVVGTAPAFDLAVVKIARTGLPTLALGDSDELEVGDAVVAIGNALALSGGSGPTVTTGIVSGLGRDVVISDTETLHDMIQTDAAINPGNSGGPLVDVRGRVIGINTAIASPQESNNVGFAIAISSAVPIIDDLRAGRKPQAAFLGVETEVLTPSAAARRHVATRSGALVVLVRASSPAAAAGLRVDDVIVAVDGRAVSRSADVFAAIRRHRPGDRVSLSVVRGSQKLTLQVTLASTSR